MRDPSKLMRNQTQFFFFFAKLEPNSIDIHICKRNNPNQEKSMKQEIRHKKVKGGR